MKTIQSCCLVSLMVLQLACSSSKDAIVATPSKPKTNEVDFWLTKGDETVKLKKQESVLSFGTQYNMYPNIEIDETQTYQSIDGFGFTLTGGSAQLINRLDAKVKQDLLQELFGTNENSISVSYLRISIGASDLNETPFTYNDLADGETDLNLTKFSLQKDENVISLLKEIIKINPTIKIMGTPWSAPLWMKDNHQFIGGSLASQYQEVYAQYLVKYIQQMKEQGIAIDAITIQNEPLHGGNNPSMVMTALQQADFIKNNLGPAFKAANIATKIITYDHNCDNAQYPISILKDTAAYPFVSGSAFHLYGGDVGALSTVHEAFPMKDLYFTEQYTGANGNFGGDLKWHLQNVIIGTMRNWSKNALEWNLANDTSFGPHTVGGCDTCKGALTIKGSSNLDRNVSYYIIAHASKFVPFGSVRIYSTMAADNLYNVAFKTPQGKKVLIVLNANDTSKLFNIKYNGKWTYTALDGGSVGTYIW
ncbi:MAG: glucosylceramidase [Sphingobacteriaceae bacterium]|nr:glucosylceramidase [Sphingobacteriaceae bacterium]